MFKIFFLFIFLSVQNFVSAQDFPIQFSAEQWDAGKIQQKRVINKIFQIQNISDQAVGIYQLIPSSPSLSARAKKTLLQAGETSDVHVQLFTDLATGLFEGYITVILIGDKRTYKFPVKAEILEGSPLPVKTLKVDTSGVPVLKIDK